MTIDEKEKLIELIENRSAYFMLLSDKMKITPDQPPYLRGVADGMIRATKIIKEFRSNQEDDGK